MIDLTLPKKTDYIPRLGDFHPSIAPYAFTGAYAGCREFPEAAMDDRHVFIMHDILRAWPFKIALEIGCFNGASSTAFVEAINSGEGLGQAGTAVFCDVSVTDSLKHVVGKLRNPKRGVICPQPSWKVLDSHIGFDFIFVDGNHDLDSVSLEMKRLLRRRPLCVMAHDTNATDAGYSQCEGAQSLKDTFKSLPDYYCLEDAKMRAGERTERGLFFATTDGELFRLARDVFKKWGN